MYPENPTFMDLVMRSEFMKLLYLPCHDHETSVDYYPFHDVVDALFHLDWWFWV